MEKYQETIEKLQLSELWAFIQNHKTVDVQFIQDNYRDLSKEEILLGLGELHALGCIIVRLGFNYRFMALDHEEIIERYKGRFLK